jgi:tetratricopeptide (TPR) repeat protein
MTILSRLAPWILSVLATGLAFSGPETPPRGDPATGASDSSGVPVATAEDNPPVAAKLTASEAPHEIQSLFALGATYVDHKEYPPAELVYQQILRHAQARDVDQRRALLELARVYRQEGAATRAVACYEKFLKSFPDDAAVPTVYLDLGRTLRTLGTFRLALASFYNVINSTMKLSSEGFEEYRTLAKTAQFEIAETHFQEGDFEEASKFFSRLQLLDLAPADRTRAQFKSAYALVLAKDHAKAALALRSYIEQNPDDENMPEARYLLSVSLERLGRDQEAFDAVLALLKVEKAHQAADLKRWVYWQRRAGNQIANEFYEQSNFWSALVIYEALTALPDQETSWQLPALYQAGLCYERLRQYDRARTDYQAVVDACTALRAKDQLVGGLDDVSRMASWRLQQLTWTEKLDRQTTQLFRTIPSATHDAHDPSGSTAKPSQVVR